MFSLVVDATALRCYEPSGIGGAQRMVDTPVYGIRGNTWYNVSDFEHSIFISMTARDPDVRGVLTIARGRLLLQLHRGRCE